MFPTWKRDSTGKAKISPAAAPDLPAERSDAGCCGGKAKADESKPTQDGAPKPLKKKGGCCG